MPDEKKELAHFRVVVRVEELDSEGTCIDVPSEQVLADFPDDQDDCSVGQKSDDHYNEVIRKCGGRV
jgi:hypothetical protein